MVKDEEGVWYLLVLFESPERAKRAEEMLERGILGKFGLGYYFVVGWVEERLTICATAAARSCGRGLQGGGVRHDEEIITREKRTKRRYSGCTMMRWTLGQEERRNLATAGARLSFLIRVQTDVDFQH